ncbi:hypothetical protein [Mycobacterium sp. ACS1612]|uniref:hypothetical protein n=1 Tax=Mycobacterium sp. ACS1612 TaxID=1834117 RepID=UPI0012EAE7EE|nr:hypothetical protein [Mycobacterium sp. ACS1612]
MGSEALAARLVTRQMLRTRFVKLHHNADDIERLEFLADQGWIIVRVSSRQLRCDRPGIVRRVRRAHW